MREHQEYIKIIGPVQIRVELFVIRILPSPMFSAVCGFKDNMTSNHWDWDKMAAIV